MILGHFTEADDGYAGALRTLGVTADLRFVRAPSDNERAPSHRILAGDVECGAAWAAQDESALLNVRLDDPTWPEPVRARLVRGRGEDLLLVWRRPAPE
ncbi:DUF736 domain-containing protein [Phenylobacterium sp.]|uniref:DUF736 domain-containing protein n=1 Tax=Phenylobacterium sp. TaxID=1871053 RepID=UPI002FE29B03